MTGEDLDAVVYDLDGTLVDLLVDWAAVDRSVGAILRAAGVDPGGLTAWELLDAAEEVGVAEQVDSLIADHERDGARRSERLPTADELVDSALPVAVCSLNCEAACRIALDRHDLAHHVPEDAVVGRDTVATRKPDPEPLLAAVRALDADPARTLFVGDSERDERTAERAGVRFRYV